MKSARLMHVITRAGRSYQVEVTGPAASFIVRPARYGARLARVIPALTREAAPVDAGDELFFPDFTLRHADGREALVELVGFWTPEYLEAKARKVEAARLENLVLVVYRGLAVGSGGEKDGTGGAAGGGGKGGALDALTSAAGMEHVVWFTDKPRAAEVVKAAERWALG